MLIMILQRKTNGWDYSISASAETYEKNIAVADWAVNIGIIEDYFPITFEEGFLAGRVN